MWDLHCGIQALFVCGRQDLSVVPCGVFFVVRGIFVVECRILVAACGMWIVGSLNCGM